MIVVTQWRAIRRVSQRVRVLLVVMLAVSASTVVFAPVHPAVAAGTYGPSGLGGGGSVNTLAIAPPSGGCATTGGQPLRNLLAGGDVFGLYRSADAGRSWDPQNGGVTSTQQVSVAGVAFQPAGGTEAYAWVGRKPDRPGGLLVNTDCGQSTTASPWRQVYPRAGTSDPEPELDSNTDRPRRVGRLLVAVNENLLIAGDGQGLIRIGRPGATAAWCSGSGFAGCGRLALPMPTPRIVRSIAKDPNDPDLLYVSYGDPHPPAGSPPHGLMRVQLNLGTGSISVSSELDAPSAALTYDVVAVPESTGTVLYVARGPAGVSRCPVSGTSLNCGPLSGLPTSPATYWTTLAATPMTNGAALFVGCSQYEITTDPVTMPPPCSSTGSNLYYRTPTSGGSRPALTPGNVSLTLLTAMAAPEQWWLSRQAAHYMIGGEDYSSSQLMLSSDAGSGAFWLYAAGRSGIWRTKITNLDGPGQLVFADKWQPAVNGLNGAGVRALSADPAGHVGIGSGDWSGLASTDRLQVNPQPIQASANDSVYATAIWQGRLFTGRGAKDFGKNPAPSGEVFACDFGPSSFPDYRNCSAADPISLGIPDGSLPANGDQSRVVALAVGQTPSQGGSTHQIVAATETNGVWTRSSTNATWTRLTSDTGSPPILSQSSAGESAGLIWSTGAKYLYIFDPVTGFLSRSPELTAAQWNSPRPWTFTRAWNSQGVDAAETNYVTGDLSQLNQPATPTTLWASTSEGPFRLDLNSNAIVVGGAGGQPGVGTRLLDTGVQPPRTGPLAVDRASIGASEKIVLARGLTPDPTVRPELWSAMVGTNQLDAMAGTGFFNQALTLDAMAISYPPEGRHVYIGNHEGSGATVNPASMK